MIFNPENLSQETVALIGIGIKNTFERKIKEHDGKFKIVAAVANDFLPPADLRESASVLPDTPRTMALIKTASYRNLFDVVVESHGVDGDNMECDEIVVQGPKTIDSWNN